MWIKKAIRSHVVSSFRKDSDLPRRFRQCPDLASLYRYVVGRYRQIPFPVDPVVAHARPPGYIFKGG
jgi:plasmid stabilization system protein ParE